MSRREQYLEALGVDLWRSRAVATATPAVSAATAPLPGWQPLRAEVSVCTRCELSKGRTQTVFGVGNTQAELLVIGEAPGADEDRQGEPFVGRAGQLLNAMLRAMGHPRESVYIANVLKCRPPGNRDPKPEEVASCRPYLQRQIELLQPLLILAVGRIAAQNLLQTDTPIGRLRGRLHRWGARATPVIVTYHPAYLLRSPGEKRKAWIDLKFARTELARLRSPALAAVVA
jgi:uracil-DNA glycosylase